MNSTAYVNKILEKDKSLRLYQNYAQLFSSYFEVDPITVSELSAAGHKLFCVFLKFDGVIDEQNIRQIPDALLLLSSAILDLRRLIPDDRYFWSEFHSGLQTWNNSCDFRRPPSKKMRCFDIYKKEVHIKSNFGILAIRALAELDSNSAYTDLLITSHKHYVVAMQLYDDCNDFKLDYVKGHMNYAIDHYEKVRGSITEINWAVKDFYISGMATEVLQLASIELDNALKSKLCGIPSDWLVEIKKLQSKITILKNFIHNYLALLKEKVSHKNVFKPQLFTTINASVWIQKSWSFIVRECSCSTNDLPHFMVLTKSEGFDGNSAVKKGDIFQRSIFIELICDSGQFLNSEISEQFQFELKQLWKLRNKTKVGGWSYLYNVDEIAPDLDDLAQVLIVFCKSEYIEGHRSYFTAILDFVFANCFTEDGGLTTWIIPKNASTKIHNKQKYLNTIYWGTGPDIEVVANFAYAVFLFDKKRYQAELKVITVYLINSKEDNKFCQSRWYCGLYYGTFQVYRILKAQNCLNELDVELIFDELSAHQNKDGGFGEKQNSPSNALQTALVLKILNLFNLADSRVAQKALMFLRNNQNKDGSYDACRFIKPRIGQYYKSKLLTSAYVFSVLK